MESRRGKMMMKKGYGDTEGGKDDKEALWRHGGGK